MNGPLLPRSCVALLLLASIPAAHASTRPSDSEDVPFCRVLYYPEEPGPPAAKAAAVKAEDPRTVRMIYFVPNDRPFRAEVVDSMKATIRQIQSFYAEEMQRHGHGNLTFRFETDDKGEPLIHRVEGQHADAHYLERSGERREIWQALGRYPIEVMVLDLSADKVPYFGRGASGVTWKGFEGDLTVATVLVPGGFSWRTVAHELGHAFDLEHDFRHSEYIMSYGGGHQARLSACAAEYLTVHPYFNPGIEAARGAPPTSLRLVSPRGYAAGSTSTPIRFEIGSSSGLYQVLLFATTELPHFAAGGAEVKACRSLAGERTATVEFDYDGVIPSKANAGLADPIFQRMSFWAVDTAGRTSSLGFSLFQLSERHIATLEAPGYVVSLAFAPGGSLASATGETRVKLWDLGARETIATFGPSSEIMAVAISPDGATLASEHDGIVKLWDLATGANTATLVPPHSRQEPGDPRFRSVAFSPPDGQSLAVVSGDSTVRLWDLATETHRDLDHDSQVTSVAYSPDGTSLASTSGEVVTLWDPATGERTAVLEGHTDWVGAVAFSPDGAALASQSGWDGLVRLWDLSTHRTVATIENTRGGSAMAFSPDGATLACASGPLVKLWDVGTRVRIDSLAHRGWVRAVAFSPDGETLATGTWKGVEVWDASEWQRPRPHGLVKISGDGQEGSPGAPLDNPLVVEVRDQYGNGVAGVPVAFAVVEGDGRLGGRFTVESRQTGDDGRASAALTLGIVPGTTTVEATLLRADPVAFEAVTVEAPIPPGRNPHKWRLPDRASVRLGRGSIEAALATHGVPVAFSPDGRRLAVAASIGTWLYDAATTRAIDLLAGAWITSAAFAPDGTVAAGSRDGRVVLWDVASGERTTLYRHGGEVHSVAFSPDGALLASHNRSSIRLWDVADRRELWSAASDASGSLAFSPDGTTLALTGRSEVRRWDVASADPVTTLSVPALDDGTEVLSAALSPDGATLATGSWTALKLWDIAQGREKATLEGHTNGISSLAFSSDGASLASGSYDSTARVWDADTRENVATFDLPASVAAVVFSPDGRTLASASWDDIWLWDIETRNRGRIPGQHRRASSSALSPDGGTVAIGSGNSTRLVDIRTGKDAATLASKAQVNAVTFSRDGSILAVGSERRVTLWDVAATRTISTLEEPDSEVHSLAFSPDGATLAAGYWQGAIRLWDVAEGESIALPAGHTSLVNSVAFSPDGSILASGSWDSTARLWDVETYQEITTLEGYFGEGSVAFSPDGATLAVASRSGIRLLDPNTWKEVNTLGESDVHSLSFSADGTTLAAGCLDGTVVLWDTETRRRVATLEGHAADVRFLAFFRDGTTLASGSRDGTVLLWDLSPQPHVLRIVSGDGQEGEPGALLPVSLVVEVRDESGDPLEGAQVTFTVAAGGGTLTTGTATTDSRGRAATTLTLGGEPGPNTVEAAVEGLETMLFTATARATPDFDGDGEVGFSDFFLFAEAFGGSDPRFDLDASGTVDFADFFLFAESFGQPARARLMALAREMIGLPEGPQLRQNWPNPFNSGTVISWFLLQPGPARLEVFALTGQRVAVLSRGHHEAGPHRLHWDGRDDRGRPLASGAYLYRLVTAEKVWARKFVLVR